MSFKIKKIKNVLYYKITVPRATIEIADQFKESLIIDIENNSKYIVVDLSEVEFVDSSFLGALVTGLKHATAQGGDLRIVGLQPPVRAMFELTRMYRIFDIFDTVEEAVESFENAR